MDLCVKIASTNILLSNESDFCKKKFSNENIIIVRLGKQEEKSEERVYIEEAFKMINA